MLQGVIFFKVILCRIKIEVKIEVKVEVDVMV